MIRILGLTLGLLAILIVSSTVDATGCHVNRQVVYQQSYAQQAAYVAPVVATYAAVPLLVPAYGASYSYDNPAQAQLLQQVKEMRLEFDLLRQQNQLLMQRLLGPAVTTGVFQSPQQQPAAALPTPAATPQLPPKDGKHPGLGAMVKNCASCHDAAVAKAKGGDLVLLIAGEMAKLSAEQRLSCVKSLLKGTMPKGGKITDDEATLVLDFVSQ